jgi:stage II sporulation protein M
MKEAVFNYYYDNKKWIVVTVRLFVVAAFLGAVAFFVRPNLLNQIVQIFESKFGPEPARDINLVKELFIQNSEACAIALIGGVILGISAFVTVFLNGFVIGFVILTLLIIPGNPLRNIGYVVLGLVPHGLFELPAFLLSSALGMRLGIEWIQKSSQGQRWQVFRQNLKRVVYSIPALAILLAIAAFTEVYISGYFVDKLR